MRKSGPERRRLAVAVRSLCVHFTEADPTEDVLGKAAEVVAGCAGRLAERPRRLRHVGYYKRVGKGGARGFDFGMSDLSPVSGAANPLAPPLRIKHAEKGRAVGTAAFPSFYGTGLGTVRNGYLAAAADEVFGAVLARLGQPIMTGILEMRFLLPCPADRKVQIDGQVKRNSGQVIFTEAVLRAGERPVAEAEAVFFVVGEEQYKRFAAERNQGLFSREEESAARERPAFEACSSHRNRFREALRELCAETVACDASEDLFRETAQAVEELVERLRWIPGRSPGGSSRMGEGIPVEGEGVPQAGLEALALPDGPGNPLAPAISVQRVDAARLSATVRFSSALEGGPGVAHGGYVAAAFDEALGLTPSFNGGAGGSARLRVRYRSPCPLNTELRLESRLHKRDEGRIVVRATMHAGDRLVADGEKTVGLSGRQR